MNFKILSISVVFFSLSSCLSFKTLRSTTYIQANNAFVLGENKHQQFNAQLTNTSANDLVVWLCPLNGGQHSPLTLKPNENAQIKVAKNTAIKIMNQSNTEASVKLKVKGDTGLSMGYMR